MPKVSELTEALLGDFDLADLVYFIDSNTGLVSKKMTTQELLKAIVGYSGLGIEASIANLTSAQTIPPLTWTQANFIEAFSGRPAWYDLPNDRLILPYEGTYDVYIDLNVDSDAQGGANHHKWFFQMRDEAQTPLGVDREWLSYSDTGCGVSLINQIVTTADNSNLHLWVQHNHNRDLSFNGAVSFGFRMVDVLPEIDPWPEVFP